VLSLDVLLALTFAAGAAIAAPAHGSLTFVA